MQISVKERSSRFGAAMVVETSRQSGAYILGFRLGPVEKQSELMHLIASIRLLYMKNPVFGVEYHRESQVLLSLSGYLASYAPTLLHYFHGDFFLAFACFIGFTFTE